MYASYYADSPDYYIDLSKEELGRISLGYCVEDVLVLRSENNSLSLAMLRVEKAEMFAEASLDDDLHILKFDQYTLEELSDKHKSDARISSILVCYISIEDEEIIKSLKVERRLAKET